MGNCTYNITPIMYVHYSKMGSLGKLAGLTLGRKIGRYAGKRLGRYTGVHKKRGGEVGEKIGAILGDLIPYRKGGIVRKTGPGLLHSGEFVLPRGVKPTRKQVKVVKRRHRK